MLRRGADGPWLPIAKPRLILSANGNPTLSTLSALLTELERTLAPGYRLVRELGGGGMSSVFLAVEVALDREVVIKVLPPETAAAVSVDRFRREMPLVARLQHPHIVPVLSSGAVGDLLFYVMPYIKGESLRARI